MPYRLVISLLFIIAALLRLAGAMVSSRPSHHATATAASRSLDPTAAMSDSRQQFGRIPDTIRASHRGVVILDDGSMHQLGDSPTDQDIRRRIADGSQTEFDDDYPSPERSPRFAPGKPMIDPTPSR